LSAHNLVCSASSVAIGRVRPESRIASSTSRTAPRCSTRSRPCCWRSFAELSAWPVWVNLRRRDTVNQFENPNRATEVSMALPVAGEIGGFGVLLAGFVVGQLL
jgi:hypothetical protein